MMPPCRGCRAILGRALPDPQATFRAADTSWLPFLYQTRTIRTASPRLASDRATFIPFEGEARITKDSPRKPRGRSQDSADSSGAEAPQDEARVRHNTLTDYERKAFGRLFDSLADKPGPDKTGRLNAQSTGEELTQADAVDLDPYLDDDAKTLEGLDGQSGSRSVASYPAQLRGMALRAQARVAHQRQEARQLAKGKGMARQDTFTDEQAREFHGIMVGLTTAKTDVELWGVLQRQLFPLFSKMDRMLVERADGPSPGPSHEPTSRENALEVLPARAYADLVLVAQRRLSRAWTRTPLSRALLPAIVRSGRVGAALGTSTKAYNTLLAEQFGRDGDASTACSILATMQEQGIPWSGETLGIVSTAHDWGQRAREGGLGPGMQAVARMRARTAAWQELGRWQEQIRQELEDNALSRSRRQELYQQYRAEGAFADDEPEGDWQKHYDEDDVHEDKRTASAAGHG